MPPPIIRKKKPEIPEWFSAFGRNNTYPPVECSDVNMFGFVNKQEQKVPYGAPSGEKRVRIQQDRD